MTQLVSRTTSILLLPLVVGLYGWLALDVPALFLLGGAILLVSVARGSAVAALGSFSASFVVSASIYAIWNLVFPFNLRTTWVIALWIVVGLAVLFRWGEKLRLPTRVEWVVLLLSAIPSIFYMDTRTARVGGSLAAIFDFEDNAAWVLTLNRITRSDNPKPGDHGAIVDLLLSAANNFSKAEFPRLYFADHLAFSIILTQILILTGIPVATALVFWRCSRREPALGLLISVSGGIQIAFLHFAHVGHLATGVAFVFFALALLVPILQFQEESERFDFRRVSIPVFLLLFLAGNAWFPISPLVVIVMLILCVTNRSAAPQSWIAGSVISILLFINFTQRVDFVAEGSLLPAVSGGASVLQMEGGVASVGGLSLLLMVALVVVLIQWKKNVIAPAVLLTACVGYSLALRYANMIIAEGEVNYGARKVESFVILLLLVLVAPLLVQILAERGGALLRPIAYFGLIATWSLLPYLSTFVGQQSMAGASDSQIVAISQAVSRNVELGRSTVCLNPTYDARPAGALRMLSYFCSRWVASLSNTDSEAKNEWRKAVLGELDQSELTQVRDSQEPDTTVILVGPPSPLETGSNPEWQLLVDPSWKIVDGTRDFTGPDE